MSLQTFQLTNFELVLTRRFHIYTELNSLATFTSDDFRLAGLDRFFKDPKHDVGILFWKWVKTRKTRKVGRAPSLLPKNQCREIKIYKWNDSP